MKIISIVIICMVLLQSCSHTIDVPSLKISEGRIEIKVYADSESQLLLGADQTFLDASVKVALLESFLTKYKDGWKKSYASYAKPSILITSNNFRLLVFDEFSVLRHNDSFGKPLQFTKDIGLNSYSFLVSPLVE